MRTKFAKRVLIWLLVTALAAPPGLMAQVGGDAGNGTDYTYSQEELDRLLAPVALYPDSLLSQILMASTYPLEVVEADRWLRNNSHLAGESLNEALKDQPWDVSVKSLCHFPRVLSTMSGNLQQTSSLGDAFLSQQPQVMDTIQVLRGKARAEGNLRSTEHQIVIEREREIIIEPARPEVVHVPLYDPCWVYGPWWYPACSPHWFWYPGLTVTGAFLFGPPIFIGHWGFWSGFHWRRHVVFVDVHKTLVFHRVRDTRLHGRRDIWRHDPHHRRGVVYRSRTIRERFGRSGQPGVEARRDFRGFRPEVRSRDGRDSERREIGPRGLDIQRPRSSGRTPEVQPRQQQAPQDQRGRPQLERPGPGERRFERPRSSGEVYQGIGRGHEVRRQSDRGWRSRESGPKSPSRVSPPSRGGGGSRGSGRSR